MLWSLFKWTTITCQRGWCEASHNHDVEETAVIHSEWIKGSKSRWSKKQLQMNGFSPYCCSLLSVNWRELSVNSSRVLSNVLQVETLSEAPVFPPQGEGRRRCVGSWVLSARLPGPASATSRRGLTSRIRYYHVSNVQRSSLQIACSWGTSIFRDDGPPCLKSILLLPLKPPLSSIPLTFLPQCGP